MTTGLLLNFGKSCLEIKRAWPAACNRLHSICVNPRTSNEIRVKPFFLYCRVAECLAKALARRE